MEASSTVIKLIHMFFLITYSRAYDNLLEDHNAVIFIEGNKATKGTEDIIDGNTSTCLKANFYKEATWVVDFTVVRSVYKIVVYLALGSRKDMIELSIFVSNSSSVEEGSLCASAASMFMGYNKSSIVERKCTYHGRVVKLKFSSFRRSYEFSICDVIITGCNNGKFGKNCSRSCSDNCVGNLCNILDGRCLSGTCSDGWQGNDCNQREGSTSTLIAEEDNITIVYALGVALTVSFLINVMLVAVGIMRFQITRKDEIYGKPSPVYVNVNNGGINQPSEGEQMDRQIVQYEALGVPSNETHYDALQ